MNDAALEVIKRCHDYQIPLARPEPQGEAALPGASPPPLPPADSDLLGLQHDGPPPYSEDDLLSRDLAALGKSKRRFAGSTAHCGWSPVRTAVNVAKCDALIRKYLLLQLISRRFISSANVILSICTNETECLSY